MRVRARKRSFRLYADVPRRDAENRYRKRYGRRRRHFRPHGFLICLLHIDVYYIHHRTKEGRPTVVLSKFRRRRWRCRPAHMALLIAVFFAFSPSAGSTKSDKLDRFAKCLAEKKATMYGSFLCPHCDDQKKLFGSSFQYVPYVECSERGSRQMTFPCMVAHIRFTPTWIFEDGERRVGLQPLKGLSEKTGCALP
jgi:hypothetical protein